MSNSKNKVSCKSFFKNYHSHVQYDEIQLMDIVNKVYGKALFLSCKFLP
ncbi:hypothetical protein JCM19314_248 [Nonlabens ulvanivorans]|uniref:Uncharacterized protein n=1 Tax=Nonlabens ulvanivorans TaxID=906888 RepID=A0A081DF59_NONUL|nr:hypothetical protein JCM19296_3163 [Nonlabens ulvanivorans]GAL01967.1 hypothetical protein JCM19314_248 [Nonlabens ulvanivorans]